MTGQAAGVGTTAAATVLGVSTHGGVGPTTAVVRDQLALTGVGTLQITVAVALVLLLAGVMMMGLVRRHAAVAATGSPGGPRRSRRPTR